ncbi:MAG: Ni/Fe hydrogenase subunit gamma [Gammaproteobacteria bacterium 28-57-27]|nr:MAG: Ni/Fe hydrogenase subunit gamma [Gammaproteobacteria bacterium 28-57-27]
MNAYLPREAEIVERIQETPTVFTLKMRLTDDAPYAFDAGQFNMLYLYGVGEVPISIVAGDGESLTHTLRAVGRVTHGMAGLRVGERIGLRGPFGRGWPLREAEGRDVVVVTGGLGCAPAVSIIHHILSHRERYGRLTILQGVKHADDLIWRAQYALWSQQPEVQVLLAADVAAPGWGGHVGLVTALFDRIEFDAARSLAMLCGPEGMMRGSAEGLHQRGLAAENIYLSMERNMQCAVGHCGHCQFGAHFVCRDGPVFAWPEIRELLAVKGF